MRISKSCSRPSPDAFSACELHNFPLSHRVPERRLGAGAQPAAPSRHECPSSASDAGGTVRTSREGRSACLRAAPQMDIWRRARIPRGTTLPVSQVGFAPGLRRTGTGTGAGPGEDVRSTGRAERSRRRGSRDPTPIGSVGIPPVAARRRLARPRRRLFPRGPRQPILPLPRASRISVANQGAGRDGARSTRDGADTRRRGARKVTRGRTRGSAPGGDGRYSDRARTGRRRGGRPCGALPFAPEPAVPPRPGAPRPCMCGGSRGRKPNAPHAEGSRTKDPRPPPDVHLRRGAETRPGGPPRTGVRLPRNPTRLTRTRHTKAD